VDRIEVNARKSERTPTVTVVVPVLNEESFLAETLASLRNQTFADFELIVVDNGSTDRSPEIARQFAEKVLVEPRRGSAWAMHRGFTEARGRFLASADADTIYPSDWLPKMVHALSRPGVVAAYGPLGFRESRKEGRALQVGGYTLFVGLSRVLGLHQVGAANFGMRKDAYIAAGGYPPLARLASSDLRLARRLAQLGEVRFVPTLVCYTSNRRFARGNLLRGGRQVVRCWLDIALRRDRLTGDDYWGRGKADRGVGRR